MTAGMLLSPGDSYLQDLLDRLKYNLGKYPLSINILPTACGCFSISALQGRGRCVRPCMGQNCTAMHMNPALPNT